MKKILRDVVGPMQMYVGLLRGVNVGGKNKIKMADLKLLLENMGLTHVRTLLQSGNVVFASSEAREWLEARIQEEIGNAFGFKPNVMLRTTQEMKAIVAECPYDAAVLKEGEGIQITMCKDEPSPDTASILSKGMQEVDEFQIQGREIYCLYRQSVLDSKLANNFQKLGSNVTTRNWNTMTKLAALAGELDDFLQRENGNGND
ncbi:Uncharacterized conserved protein, DUF1697 family [Paenibacillus sp. cl6col]|uniref:DUF1697 domain-containing protein n=1 Tax=Paenibacillus alvei TaxID=44250 RepID=A0ABT4EDF8_PAEAL|nr:MULTISPECIES: DUF1697 domain-containing protein [Paenibacillus]MCY9531781.1 DUF1697 domain-containing protein [Paenibacillus alvei]SDG06411.1 Uncharacterized conserved protein, DUF1697 family [Paenibacillus sp. cl6col]